MVFEHEDQHDSQWAAIRSVAEKIGCSSETLRHWVRRAERDQGRRPGLTTDERARLKAQEREIRELRRAKEAPRRFRTSSANCRYFFTPTSVSKRTTPGLAARGRSLFAEPRCSGSLAMSD